MMMADDDDAALDPNDADEAFDDAEPDEEEDVDAEEDEEEEEVGGVRFNEFGEEEE